MSRKPIILTDPRATQKRSRAYNKRLFSILSVLTVLGFLAVSLYFNGVRRAEQDAIESRLETITELRHAALSRFMNSQDQETRLWANHVSIRDAAEAFFDVWSGMNVQEQRSIREGYLSSRTDTFHFNSAPMQAYVSLHEKVYPTLQAFQTHHEYYDVFLFNIDGDLVYTNEKEDDFGLNFSAQGDTYKDTGLGQIFRQALSSKEENSSFADFAAYAPSNGDAASFLAKPIYDTSDTVIGVYAIQLPMDNFNAKLQYASGLGETGETYLVGKDLKMRNDSRLSETSTSLVRVVDTLSVRAALSGQEIVRKGLNLHGRKTLVAAKPMDFNGTRWAVVTEVEMAEIWAPFRPYLLFYFIALLFVFGFGCVQYFLLRVKIEKTKV